MSDTIKQCTEKVGERISKFGLEQTREFKKVYNRELLVLCVSLLLVSSAIFLFSLTYMVSTFELYESFKYLLSHQLQTIASIMFSILAGYAIYTWKNSISTDDKAKLENPTMLFIIIFVVGLFAGNIIRHVSYFESLNFALVMMIMVIVTILMVRVFAMNIFAKIYSFWRNIQEFRQYRVNNQ